MEFTALPHDFIKVEHDIDSNDEEYNDENGSLLATMCSATLETFNTRKRPLEEDDEPVIKTNSSNKKSSKKNKVELFYDTAIDTLQALARSLNKDDDDVTGFTKHVEASLRALPSSSRSLAKLNIQNILYKAEMRTLLSPLANK